MRRRCFAPLAVVVAAASLTASRPGVAADERAAPAARTPAGPPDADTAADDDADEREPRAARVPPVPDGTPAEILRYVESISDPAAMPRSRGRRRYYMKRIAAAFVEAADRLLAKVAADDPLYPEAVRLKYDGLSMLDEMGDKEAMPAMTAFARTLVDSPHPAVARKARRMALAADVDALYAARSAAGAEALIKTATALLEADRDDAATAKIAAQFAVDLTTLPDAELLAKQAHEAFAPLLAASENPQIRGQGERLAFTLRRLGLQGRPLALAGRLADGTEFDAAALTGKVVLVGFWSTGSEPCRAAIAAVQEHYERYRGQGLEVVGVSLDADQEAVPAFVAEQKLPWPMILDGRDPQTSLADKYGVEVMPTVFLVGRDGTVLSLRAKGEPLAALLAEQFPDAR